MAAVLWLTTSLLLLYGVHSYILLTANMEDVQAIARQMLSSPVAGQLSRIWRRASLQFHQRLKSPRVQRAGDKTDSDVSLEADFRQDTRRVLNELSDLGKNASVYLKSLRRIFEKFINE